MGNFAVRIAAGGLRQAVALSEAVSRTLNSAYRRVAGTQVEPTTANHSKVVPAVAADQSVTDSHIFCLEDGKPFKILKRHLRTAHGLSPEEYRDKWGLEESYPLVAPSYSVRRSNLAKEIGLGHRPRRRGPRQGRETRARKAA